LPEKLNDIQKAQVLTSQLNTEITLLEGNKNSQNPHHGKKYAVRRTSDGYAPIVVGSKGSGSSEVAAVATSLETLSALELHQTELPPLREIVNGLLPQGLALLCAPSKYGKSWLSLDLCLSVAAGWKFLGFPTERSGVLYLALEDGHRRLKKRRGQMLQNNPPPENFYLAIKAGTVDNGLSEQIGTYLKEKPNTGLIVVDVLQRVRSSGQRGVSAYALDYADMGVLKNIADTHQLCVMAVHHLRKMPDKDDPFNMISGTNGIMGCADTIFVITKKSRESKEAVLHTTGRDVESSELVIEFDSTFLYKWKLVGTLEEQKAKDSRAEYDSNPVVKTIKALLVGNPEGFRITAGDFAAKMPEHAGEYFTPNAVGMAFKEWSKKLYDYDKIIFTPGDTKTRIHSFKKQAATLATVATTATLATIATDDELTLENLTEGVLQNA